MAPTRRPRLAPPRSRLSRHEKLLPQVTACTTGKFTLFSHTLVVSFPCQVARLGTQGIRSGLADASTPTRKRAGSGRRDRCTDVRAGSSPHPDLVNIR
jgi:hypothetical protein